MQDFLVMLPIFLVPFIFLLPFASIILAIAKFGKEPKGLDEREYLDYLKVTTKVHQGTFFAIIVVAIFGGVNIVVLGLICLIQLLAESHYRNKLSK